MNITEFVRLAIDEGLSGVHTCMPATIEQYEHSEQRCSVKPLLKRKYRDGQVESMPVIERVPMIFPASGGASLTFPVKRGDGVLLVFSERAMENWLSQGGEQEPGDTRRMDLTDAIAIPGLAPFSQKSPSSTNDDVELIYKGFRFTINSDGRFEMGNDVEELLSFLEEFLQAVIDSICIPFSELSELPKFVELLERLQFLKGVRKPGG